MVFSDASVNFDIWALPIDPQTGTAHGDKRRITLDDTMEVGPSLSSDGNLMAYLTGRSNAEWILRVRQLKSGADQTLLSSQAGITAAQISGDGSRIIYSDLNSQLFAIPTKGGISEKLCDRCGTLMGVSPDGTLALYEPIKDEDLLGFDAGKQRTITLARRESPDDFISGSQLSPDGKWVAFFLSHKSAKGMQIAHTTDVWIAPVLEGMPAPHDQWIQVTSGPGPNSTPCWSKDGRFLYFLSERDGSRCIWGRRLDPVSKKVVGEVFPVQHFHSARASLRMTGTRTNLTGLSGGSGDLVFSIGEMTGNVWLQESPAR
jgi:Tol biopolymer transport system component